MRRCAGPSRRLMASRSRLVKAARLTATAAFMTKLAVLTRRDSHQIGRRDGPAHAGAAPGYLAASCVARLVHPGASPLACGVSFWSWRRSTSPRSPDCPADARGSASAARPAQARPARTAATARAPQAPALNKKRNSEHKHAAAGGSGVSRSRGCRDRGGSG